MNHLVELYTAKQRIQGRAIRDIATHELERLAQGFDGFQIALLEAGIVEIIQIIEGPDGVAGQQQSLAKVRANKACAAGYEEIHRRKLTKPYQVPSSKFHQSPIKRESWGFA